MTAFELAKRYYPRLWSGERINALVEAGRLTEAERAEIVGGKTDPVSESDTGGDGDDP